MKKNNFKCHSTTVQRLLAIAVKFVWIKQITTTTTTTLIALDKVKRDDASLIFTPSSANYAYIKAGRREGPLGLQRWPWNYRHQIETTSATWQWTNVRALFIVSTRAVWYLCLSRIQLQLQHLKCWLIARETALGNSRWFDPKQNGCCTESPQCRIHHEII